MSKRIFITGTGTGVGKTAIGRALVRAARNRGIDAVAVKPVESGVVNPCESDAYLLAKAAMRENRNEKNCLYSFSKPVSPHLAAEYENRIINPNTVCEFLRDWTSKSDLVLAEGAGGLLVPLGAGVLFVDIVVEIGFEILVVAPNILGTINTTLLTIEACKSRGLNINGVVLNGSPTDKWGNAQAIEAYGKVQVLGEFPTTDLADDSVLADFAEKHLVLDSLFSN